MDETQEEIPQANETVGAKRERFTRYAEKRTQAVIDGIELLSRISNRKAYSFTDAEAESICAAIQDATLNLSKAFFPDPPEPEKAKPAFRLPS